MKENDKVKEAYQEILKVCEKHEDVIKLDYYHGKIREMICHAKNHLLIIEWDEKYGLTIPLSKSPYSSGYLEIKDYKVFSKFGDAKQDKDNQTGKSISWSDDGRQPINEWLFELKFPTGAYIFGGDYEGQQDLFRDFFCELKTFKPNFVDTANHCLYWKLENAKAIFDGFEDIYKKYREINTGELNKRKADKLRKELAKLEKENK